MNETLTVTYPKPYLGNYIDRWHVVNHENVRDGKIYRYKTESGALRMYDKLKRADLFRETNCKGADVLIMSK